MHTHLTPSTQLPHCHNTCPPFFLQCLHTISPLGLQSVAAYPLLLGMDMSASATCQLVHHIHTNALQHDATQCVISWQCNLNHCIVPIKWYAKHGLGTGTKLAPKVWPASC